MLIEFSAENFRSLKDKIVLSLIASPKNARDKDTNQNNLIPINEQLSLLRGVAIYGANASGKSNIIRAFALMRSVVSKSASFQEEDLLPMEPFMLTEFTQKAPTTFQAIFMINGIQYRYGFTADTTKILAEWLFALTSSRESAMFTRSHDDVKYPNGIEVNRAKFREGLGTEHKTGDNQLFLSKVAADQGSLAKQVRDFFVKQCGLITNSTEANYTVECLDKKRNGYEEKIVELVRRLDVDVVDLRVEKEEMPEKVHRLMVATGTVRDKQFAVNIYRASNNVTHAPTAKRRLA
jgi:hypothetical protein